MFSETEKVRSAVQSGFQNAMVLVIGDLILDRYLWGNVERISPEAPVPVVHLDHQSHAPGGAANVAANLTGLGCKVTVAGLIGDDDAGRQLREMLEARGMDTSCVLEAKDRPTISKTRIIGGRQQMLRLDSERVGALDGELHARFMDEVGKRMTRSSVVVLSDYGKGLLDDEICRAIIRRARELGKPVLVDPKGRDYKKYAGCDWISPNRMELAAATRSEASDMDRLLEHGEALRRELGIGHLIATLGDLGIALLDSTGVHRFPAVAREVFDVSGAGDTVVATLAAAIAAGLSRDDSIRLANVAAGIVIGKVGTVPVAREELAAALATEADPSQAEKICSPETLVERVAHWRAAGQRVVFTNGCFDLFHVGHLTLLEHAKREGDRLIVALNTDRSVRDLKGEGRPVISQDSRARLVAALPCVDAVAMFDEATPLNLIRSIKPHVLVKGGNLSEKDVVGAKEMKEWGGKVTLIPPFGDFSTTTILKKAAASLGGEAGEKKQD